MTRQEAAEVLEELTKPGRFTILAPEGVYDAIKMAIDAIDMVDVLADILDGRPLKHPCDKLWNAHGHWCMNHCADGQTVPDAECWIKYAEVMVYDQTGSNPNP